MKTSRIVCCAVIVGVQFAQACGMAPPGTAPTPTGVSPTEIPGPETRALASTLQRQGATVTFAEVMLASGHPYFRVRAARYLLNGENLQAFEYESADQTASDASRIGPDGTSIGATQVDWVSDPHFYRSGRLIVLYVGRGATILALLQSVLGPQIAGR